MAQDRAQGASPQGSRPSLFGRVVTLSLVAASAVRGLRKGADPAPPAPAGAAPGPASATARPGASAERVGAADPARPGTGQPGAAAPPSAAAQTGTAQTGAAQTGAAQTGAPEPGESRPGEGAETPTQIPPAGWWQVIRRAFKEGSADNVSMLAAGVAFFAFLAIPPALIAALSLYGLVADPQTVARQMQSLAGSLPKEVQPLIADQLNAVATGGAGALSVGLVVSILAALWSASSGTSNLMSAINIAYDEEEARGFLKLRAIALALTIGAIVFVLLTLFLVAVVPPLLEALQLGVASTILAQVFRWALLVVLVVVALAIVYRLAPNRNAPKFRWTSLGAVVAAVLWIIGSIVFSLYVNNFGSYNKTYGTIAGVIVFLLWLYLTSYIILLGAEINAESEKQTEADTTVGPPVPMGERDAVAADSLADGMDPQKTDVRGDR